MSGGHIGGYKSGHIGGYISVNKSEHIGGQAAMWAEHTGNAPAAQDCIAGPSVQPPAGRHCVECLMCAQLPRSVQPQAGLGALCSVPCPIHVTRQQ